jgi:hypothetical protein
MIVTLNAFHARNIELVGVAVAVKTCVLEVFGSNVGRETYYHNYFRGFPQYQHRDSTPIKSLSLPYKSFSFHLTGTEGTNNTVK